MKVYQLGVAVVLILLFKLAFLAAVIWLIVWMLRALGVIS